MWERIRRFRRLPPQTRLLFVRAAFLLPLVSWKLHHIGFAATQKWLQVRSEAQLRKEVARFTDSADLAQSVERAVAAAARYGLGHPTCLERSLVIWSLLLRQGVSSDLRIGVRKHEGKFEAHAWVEHHGHALGDADAAHQHYAAFDADLSQVQRNPQ